MTTSLATKTLVRPGERASDHSSHDNRKRGDSRPPAPCIRQRACRPIRRKNRIRMDFRKVKGPHQRPAGPGRRCTMGCAKEAATPRDGAGESGLGEACWLSPCRAADRLRATQRCRPAQSSGTLAPPEALFLVEPWKIGGVRFVDRRCGLPLFFIAVSASVLEREPRNASPRRTSVVFHGSTTRAPPAASSLLDPGCRGTMG